MRRPLESSWPGLAPLTTYAVGNPFVDVEPELPAEVRRVPVLRAGKWLALATEELEGLEVCGRSLSKELARSVLTLATSDDEGVVLAKRWKHGRLLGQLTLPEEAQRGADGRPRASAAVLRPWLSAPRRRELARAGLCLSETPVSEDEPVWLDEQTTTTALLAAIGAPQGSPWAAPGSVVWAYAQR